MAILGAVGRLVNGTIKSCLLFLVVINKYSLKGKTFLSIRQLLHFVRRLKELKATDRTGSRGEGAPPWNVTTAGLASCSCWQLGDTSQKHLLTCIRFWCLTTFPVDLKRDLSLFSVFPPWVQRPKAQRGGVSEVWFLNTDNIGKSWRRRGTNYQPRRWETRPQNLRLKISESLSVQVRRLLWEETTAKITAHDQTASFS